MRAREIFEVDADYGFLERRFEQRISSLWALAPDDPETALRIAHGMQVKAIRIYR